MKMDETNVRSSHSLPVFCFNCEALNDKMRVHRFVPHSNHITKTNRLMLFREILRFVLS